MTAGAPPLTRAALSVQDSRDLLDLLQRPATDADAAQSALRALRGVPATCDLSAPDDPWAPLCADLDRLCVGWARDANPDIRYQALSLAEARALAGPAYVAALPDLLRDPDAEVRMLAAQALSRLGAQDHIAPLRAALASARLPEERLHLLNALRALGAADLCAPLLACLRHGPTRFATIEALGALGDIAAAPALRKLARRWWGDPFERVAAAASLCQLSDPDGPALLHQFAHSSRAEVRGFALQAAARLRLPDAIHWLLTALQRKDDPAAAIVPPLLLAYADDPAAAAALQRALQHPNPEVRDAARAARSPSPPEPPS